MTSRAATSPTTASASSATASSSGWSPTPCSGAFASRTRPCSSWATTSAATGDSTAAHKLLVLMAGIAREYRYLATFTEHRYQQYQQVVAGERYRQNRDEYLPGPEIITDLDDLTGSGMDDYCINMPKLYRGDLAGVRSRLRSGRGRRRAGAPRLGAQCRGSQPARRCEPSWKRTCCDPVCREHSTTPSPPTCHGRRRALLQLVRVIDQPECVELVDWLLYGKGEVAAMPVNFYYKDGAAYESPGYNGTHVAEMIPLALGLRALCEDDPVRYPPERYDVLARSPRLRHIFGWAVDIIVAGRTCPYIGDTGEQPSAIDVLPPKYMMDIGNREWITETASAFFPDDPRFPAALEAVRPRAGTPRGASCPTPTRPIAPLEPEAEPATPLASLRWLRRGYPGIGRGRHERRGVWLYYGDHPASCARSATWIWGWSRIGGTSFGIWGIRRRGSIWATGTPTGSRTTA